MQMAANVYSAASELAASDIAQLEFQASRVAQLKTKATTERAESPQIVDDDDDDGRDDANAGRATTATIMMTAMMQKQIDAPGKRCKFLMSLPNARAPLCAREILFK